jgi:peroxiredoxin
VTETTEPPTGDLQALVATMIERLRAEGTVPGIELGERAPEFTLPDAYGRPVALKDRIAAGPVVISFYRGAWCPICNTELTALQQALPAINERGASLVAITPEPPDASQAFVQKLGLGFDVLSDLDQQVIRAYHLQFPLDEDLRPFYRSFNMALDERNADGSWNLPVPATFVLDRDGIVRARHVDPNYRQRMTIDDLLSALDQMEQDPTP